MPQRKAAGGAGVDGVNRFRTACRRASKRVPRLATCQPSSSAFQCSAASSIRGTTVLDSSYR
jgi:hypothetical protein